MSKKLLKSDDLKECWVEAFKTGKVMDLYGMEHDYSESDLEDLNEGIHDQLKKGYQPPMVKGHPKLEDPRVASIVDSKVDGDVLKVKLDDVNPEFAEEVKNGGFKYLSSAVYSNLKKGLRHLGALGAHAPAMKGMAPLCFGEGMFAETDKGTSEKDVIVFAEPFAWDRLVPRSAFESLIYKLGSIGKLFRSQREALIEKSGVENADKVFPEYAVKDLETIGDVLKRADEFPKVPTTSVAHAPESATNFAENTGCPSENGDGPKAEEPSPTEPTALIAQGHSEETTRLREENAAMKAELDAIKAEKQVSARKADFTAFSEKLDSMITSGRMNQSVKKGLEKVFKAMQMLPLDGEGCFGEGDGRVNPMKALDDALDAMPKIVEFGEVATPGEKEPMDKVIAKYHAEQMAKGRKISFAEAAEECCKYQRRPE